MSKTREQSNMHLNIAVAKTALSQFHVPTKTQEYPLQCENKPTELHV